MQQELQKSAGNATLVSNASGRAAALEQIAPNLSDCREAATQSFNDILDICDSLSIKIAHYTILHSVLNHSTGAEDAEAEEALDWMQTALEDIAATLRGISEYP